LPKKPERIFPEIFYFFFWSVREKISGMSGIISGTIVSLNNGQGCQALPVTGTVFPITDNANPGISFPGKVPFLPPLSSVNDLVLEMDKSGPCKGSDYPFFPIQRQ
jgi:hypothetical protein